MFKLTIPKPCHADWNQMTPTQQGAFCGSCNKEVVDFTVMSDDEVRDYFLNKTTGNTCGHFRKEQIHRIRISLPENIFIQKIAGWKKFMAIVLLAFGNMLFGCDIGTDKNTNGEIIIQKKIEIKVTVDTTFQKGESYTAQQPDFPPLLGTVAFTNPDSITCVKRKPDERPTIDGEIEMIPIGKLDNKINLIDSIDTTDYDKIFTGNILLEKSDKMIDTLKKKPASDTGKCKDFGFF